MLVVGLGLGARRVVMGMGMMGITTVVAWRVKMVGTLGIVGSKTVGKSRMVGR